MSRSGFVEFDGDELWGYIRGRGAVMSAVRGKRGQKLLKDLLAALDAMPEKKLIIERLEDNGAYCALGALGAAREIDLRSLDVENYTEIAEAFGCADSLVREIEFMNDEGHYIDRVIGQGGKYMDDPDADFKRWKFMREWVASKII